VRDNGLGLTREAQKMIFTRFYRVTHGNLHNIKGFGLGLSYVKSIVEAHKGTISLKSKINKGTSIELFFPNKK
jgi:two-component system phosphate regulon sensor histidine kinase PhoR